MLLSPILNVAGRWSSVDVLQPAARNPHWMPAWQRLLFAAGIVALLFPWFVGFFTVLGWLT